MKTRIYMLILSFLLIFSGCSNNQEQPVSDLASTEDILPDDTVTKNSLYEQFLNNEIPTTISNNVDHGSYFSFDDYEGAEFTLEELVNAIIAEYIGDNDDVKIWLDGIEYAYIDCGADGNEELALHIKTPMQAEGWNEYYIIKEDQGKLKTVYSEVAWSRSYTHINEYGYIYGDGSGGAAYHSFTKSYVDGEGIWHYIYSDSTEYIVINEESNGIGASSGYHELTEEEIAKYKGDYLLIDFDFSNPDPFNADSYGFTDNIHSYGKIANVDDPFLDFTAGFKNYSYCILEDDTSIYNEDCPLKKIYGKSNGFYTLSEIDQMIADKEKEEGLTDTIKNGAEANWTPLEINFEPYISTFNNDNFLNEKAYFPLYFTLSRVEKGTATRIVINKDGTFDGSYNDYDSETRINTMNEFSGRFVSVERLDDYSYSMTINNLKYVYTPNTEGYEQLSNGYEAYRRYITPYGLEDDNAIHFKLYIPGAPISSLPESIFDDINEYHLQWFEGADTLNYYILYNTDAEYHSVWISN